jgi:dual specificity phosphatase 12
MTPLQTTTRVIDKASISPPILMNPKCSGYFVEPMKWMEFFIEDGQLAGKIICPNKKCGAKLGNYDWAGVCCNCKEWVVPGFCIHRSKVDEIV